tara:strand:- start:34 stop:519 length:486 start_codon:yes stop_codon:yes gene_type:complete
MEEIWKDIPGYEGTYKVSNLGRVVRLSRPSKDGFSMIGDRILKQHASKNGYFRVNVKGKPKYVHQLVAMAFLNHVPCGLKNVVDHIDNNPLNNNLNNLQLTTNRRNTSKDKKPKSGFTGVDFNQKKWRAQIRVGGRKILIGRFKTPEEASAAYQKYISENI